MPKKKLVSEVKLPFQENEKAVALSVESFPVSQTSPSSGSPQLAGVTPKPKRGRPAKLETPPEVKLETPDSQEGTLKDSWEKAGQFQADEVVSEILVSEDIPPALANVAASLEITSPETLRPALNDDLAAMERLQINQIPATVELNSGLARQ